MLAFLLVTSLTCTGKLAEYRLSVNFGQKFADYSGNEYHGVNGDSHLTTTKDTIPTDRGAYFNGETMSITAPKNTFITKDLTLIQPFTILCWITCISGKGVVFTRYLSGDIKQSSIEISRVDRDKKISLSGAFSGKSFTKDSPKNSFGTSK